MWTCPKCNRNFKTTNQSHTCGATTIDALFMDKPDFLVLAFDKVLQEVMTWEPCSVGAAKKAIVFTNKKAWLIIRPMKKELDIKIYQNEPIDSDRFHKISEFMGKYAHHIRVQHEDQIDDEVFELLRMGYDFAIN